MRVELFKRPVSKYWQMRYTINNQVIRESTKTTRKRHAEKVAMAKEESLMLNNNIIRSKLTLQNLLDEVKESYKREKLKSWSRLEWAKKNIIKFFDINELITNINIDKYIEWRLGSGCQNGTINRELGLLKKGYRLLKEKKQIYDIPLIKFLAENGARQGFLERWQYLELMKHLPKHIQPVIQLLYKTGIRKSEAIEMKWSWCNLEDEVVYIPYDYDKIKQGRPIPLDDELLELFKKLYEINKSLYSMGIDTDFIFLNSKGDGQIRSFQRSWRTACITSNLPDLFVHDLRRTAIRNLIRSGVPESIVMKISGHKTRSVMNRYNIVNLDDVKNAMKQQQDYLNSLPTKKPEPKNTYENEELIKDIMTEAKEKNWSVAEMVEKWKANL